MTMLAPIAGPGFAPTEVLTERQREVLTLMADGLTDAEIASTLWISHATAKSHAAAILERLAVASRAHAVAVGFRAGFLH
jgi:DNA-binding NarL/FixJ family response regulator